MSDVSYISTNVENGLTFDDLVGNLLAYKPDHWGYSEQDYNTIATDFGVESNSLYYLPDGNYKMENLPNFPILSTFVNLHVFTKGNSKCIIADIGGSKAYSTELSSVSDPIEWTDTTIQLFHIDETAPTNSAMLWVDTSKLSTTGEVYLKYYNGSAWISCSSENIMKMSVYDPQGIKKDPIAVVTESLKAYIDKYGEFIRHKNNELTWMHLTNNERIHHNTYMLTTAQVAALFSINSDIYNALIEAIIAKSDSTTNYSVNEKIVSDASEMYSKHTESHVAAAQIELWDSKAAGDHRHDQDPNVYIDSSNIGGDETISSDQLPYDVKERIYSANSESEVYAMQKNPLHNGDIVYVEDAENGDVYYFVVDDTYLGNSEIDRWSEGTISDTSRRWMSVCYGDGKYVAVSYVSNVFAYSTDGISWTEVTVGTTNRSWNCVCYGNGTFVAVTFNTPMAAYSNDGITWTEVKIDGASLRDSNFVCYGNGKFIAVGRTNTYTYSTDGITWTFGVIGELSKDCGAICYGNGKFVILNGTNVSSNVYAYSTDGINWTEGTISDMNRYWQSVCYGNGKYVGVAYESNVFAYSYNGIDWVEDTMGDTSREWMSVCYGNGKFIAVADSSNVFAHATLIPASSQAFKKFSTKLEISWSDVTDTPTTLEDYGITDGVTYAELKEVSDRLMVKHTPANLTAAAIGSNNVYVGIQRTLQSTGGGTTENPMGTKYSDLDILVTNDSNNDLSSTVDKFSCAKNVNINIWETSSVGNTIRSWSSVCYGNGKFIAVAENSNVYAYSTDGINWIEGTISDTSRKWYSVCYGKDKFVALAYESIFAYSYDGISWTEGTINSTYNCWVCICYGNGKFVAVGQLGLYAYSIDGINWTAGTINLYRTWNCVCYGNGMYIIVSGSSYAYSTDGITWTEGTISDTNGGWSSVCYGNGKFVTLASSVYYAYSMDGIVWVESVLPGSDRQWKIVCYDNSKFVILTSASGYFAYSYNAIDWIEGETEVSGISYSLCYGNDKFVSLSRTSTTVIYASSRFDCTSAPYSEPGLYQVKTPILASNYFSTLYSTDQENPQWNSHGLGRMIKVDTSKNNTIISDTFVMNGNAYLVSVRWDTSVGIVFDIKLNEALNSIQDIHDNFVECDYAVISAIDAMARKTVAAGAGSVAHEWNFIPNRAWHSVCYGNGKYVALVTDSTAFAYSYDGITWTEGTISSANQYWQSVCYGNGKFVAVASYSNIFAYSDDGITWIEGTIGGRKDYISVCYGKDKYVMVSIYANYFAYSVDGITLTQGIISSTSRNWYSVCYGNGKYVAISNTNVFAYSTDGITWIESTIGDVDRSWRSICYGNGKFVAVADNSNVFAYSTDGITWIESTISDTNRGWYSVCYGGGKFVAMAIYSNIFAYSTDGITWTEGTIGNTNRSWWSVCYGNEKFVSVGEYSNINANIYLPSSTEVAQDTSVASGYNLTFQIATEYVDISTTNGSVTNGVITYNFTNVKAGDVLNLDYVLTPTKIGDIEYVVSELPSYVSGTWNSDYTKFIVTSIYGNGMIGLSTTVVFDGITWTEGTISSTSRYWYSVCYGNGKFIAIARDSNVFAYSTDGITWTEGTISSTSRAWSSVCYGDGKFVAIVNGTTGSYIAYSTNGISWTEVLPSSYFIWYRICYGGNKFVIMGIMSDEVAYSTDGINWTIVSVYYTESNDICYGKDKFVIVSGFGECIYSTNGISWTNTTIGTSKTSWYAVDYGADKFVAISYDSTKFAYSTDGITWTEGATGSTSRTVRYICYGEGIFVAVSATTKFAYSMDGIVWTDDIMISPSRQWYSLCYGNGKFISVANNSNKFAYGS